MLCSRPWLHLFGDLPADALAKLGELQNRQGVAQWGCSVQKCQGNLVAAQTTLGALSTTPV